MSGENMEEYVDIEGSKAKVAEGIMEACSLDQETVELCLDFIKNNQEILSKEELFQHCQMEEYEAEGISELVSEQGAFYISLKKSTIFLAILYMGNKVPGFKMAKAAAEFLGISGPKGGFLKLDAKQGYLCIMLELARHRRHGAEKTVLRAFQGECCNNQLDCKYNENGLCNCNESIVEKICEELVSQAVVQKRGKKYYYVL